MATECQPPSVSAAMHCNGDEIGAFSSTGLPSFGYSVKRMRAVEKKYKTQKLRNPVEKLGRCEWTIGRGTSGQSGGATKSALTTT